MLPREQPPPQVRGPVPGRIFAESRRLLAERVRALAEAIRPARQSRRNGFAQTVERHRERSMKRASPVSRCAL